MEAPKAFPIEPVELGEFEIPLRPPVVHGLVRRGEVLNWIASPKTGKTWMAYSLIAAVLTGGNWCDHMCEAHRVLLVDNELHRETGLNRLHKSMAASRVPRGLVAERLDAAWMRGKRATLEDLEATIRSRPRGTYGLIVLDALYRFIPRGAEENSNSDMTQLYNALDAMADYADAAIMVVHHAAKGTQSGKADMDVGAGAGAIGRATDSHCVFIAHEEDNCVVMRAKCRSFKSPIPKVLSVDGPRIEVVHDLDPEDLQKSESKTPRRK